MYYAYILKSINFDEMYVGSTNNLIKRIDDHNSGKSLHTKKFKPWKIVTYVAFDNKQRALQFEKYLKTGSGRAFVNKHF